MGQAISDASHESNDMQGRDTEEQLSDRHVVLGTNLRPPFPDGIKLAVFATGCYWGAEKGFWRLPGVFSTAVGYAGGHTKNPTYRETCTGQTGHTEAVFVAYNPELISYADLLRQFWECHDPAQLNGQGGDHGTQYRSAAYAYDDEQLQLALTSRDAYQTAIQTQIHTEIKPMSEAGPFYYAHEEYQQYLARPGSRQYCSAQPRGVSLPPFETWAPAELQAKHAPKLPEAFWRKYGPKPHCSIKGPNTQIVWNAEQEEEAAAL